MNSFKVMDIHLPTMNPMIGRETRLNFLFYGEGLIRVHIRAKH